MRGKHLFPLLALLLAVPFSAAAQRPNVILILMDDMGWGDLPAYQDQRMKEGLPAMDNPGLRTLAREGMTLTRHYSSAPLCAPARGSLFTGVHQGHAKVIRDRSFDLPIEDAPTLGTVMQSAGYKTALIGKWGIGGGREHAGTPQESTAYPTRRGFDYYFGYLDHVSGHHHYPKEDPNPISPTKKSGIWDGDKCVTADCDKAYSVDLLTARAKKWIVDTHRQNPRQPFFLALTHIAPHSQLQIPTGPYPEGRGVKGGVQWLGKPHKLVNTAEGKINSYIYPRYADKKWPMAQKRYATMIARLSDSFEDLIQTLKDLNIDKNTVIIMTSNIGAKTITDSKKLGFTPAEDNFDRNQETIRENVMDELKRSFRPEFLNRIDDIIVFKQLDREDIKKIASRLCDSVVKSLKELGITLSVEDSAIDVLVEKGFDVTYGARPLKRAIQSLIEDKMAEKMLEKTFSEGDEVVARGEDGKIVFAKKGEDPVAETTEPKAEAEPEDKGNAEA